MRERCVPLNGFVYRAHNPRWSFAPDSGTGAAKFGGRFNSPGVKAPYTSLSFKSAWSEAQQGFPLKPQPLTLVVYEVDYDAILDLSDRVVREATGIHDDVLAMVTPATEAGPSNRRFRPAFAAAGLTLRCRHHGV